MNKKSKKLELICFCNQVSKEVIEKAIQEGAQTLNEIYDKTTAGIGPCGGSCRRKIAPILEEFLSRSTPSAPKKSS
ncbi:MAG: (2Fe-2S)-binding protein [Oligoflexia bacterium]|nr:(2Fe-2S)-binding protein [Oligoflexia bacterium]